MHRSPLKSTITAEQNQETVHAHKHMVLSKILSHLPALAQLGTYTLGKELPFAFSADADSFSPSGFIVGGLL